MDANAKLQKILSSCDHTLLTQTATWNDIREICNDGIKYGTASVCIPPAFVKRAKEYVGERLKICTVIGFPNGYQTTAVKVFETRDAIENGADEIDMVINIGELKARNFGYLMDEISAIKAACGDKILKVIIETCLLSESEKVSKRDDIVVKMKELIDEFYADGRVTLMTDAELEEMFVSLSKKQAENK